MELGPMGACFQGPPLAWSQTECLETTWSCVRPSHVPPAHQGDLLVSMLWAGKSLAIIRFCINLGGKNGPLE